MIAANPTLAQLPLRDELRNDLPYGAPQLDVPVRLNVNENPYRLPAEVQAAMASALGEALRDINRYPDREATGLREKLAAYLGQGLTAGQIWAANGSNELMVQVLQAFGGPQRSVVTFSPSYSMYSEYARDSHTAYVEIPRRPDFQIDVDDAVRVISKTQPAVVVIATPNNPTGTSSSLEQVRRLLDAAKGIVVVDEAYQEFSSGQSAIALLPDFGNLIVSRTMSKAFAFAGARVGYCASNPAVVDALRIVRLPYHLSALTQAAASAALDHAPAMLRTVAHLIDLRGEAIERMRAMGLTAVDSDANFFLFGPFADRHQVWRRLLERGVLVRETGPSGHLRVSVGTDAQMDQFFQALEQILKGGAL